MDELRYIAIEGVIGAGKTSLAKKISEALNARLILEQFEQNPFLEKFYQHPKRFAFQTQMFFLISRYKQQQELDQETLFNIYTISDYTFDKDRIFAQLTLFDEEFKLYDALFPTLAKNIRQPDLVVYLQSDVDRLMYNIRKRSRDIESSISRNYIQQLSEAYNDYFFKYDKTPLLIIDTTEIDFVNNETEFDDVLREIFRAERAKKEFYKPERKTIL